MVALPRRHINEKFGVTRSPSDAWVARQLREAPPFGEGPRFLIRDNDNKYGAAFDQVSNKSSWWIRGILVS
jgi:hypothetical protein